jgi:DNA-binding GntR family transcriptional regulator
MIVQESLVSLAAEEIRQLIIGGGLAPGDKLNEPPLAVKLGISRPPLREALRMLESEGLLEQTPRRGYRVMTLSDADIEEIYTLRFALEGFALELLLAKDDPSIYDGLDAVMKRMVSAAKKGDHAKVVNANVEFHTELVRAAGHSRLFAAYRQLMLQMRLSMARNVLSEAKTKGDLGKGCERHALLVESLRSGDPERIRRDFAEHGERDYLKHAADAPDAAGARGGPKPAAAASA